MFQVLEKNTGLSKHITFCIIIKAFGVVKEDQENAAHVGFRLIAGETGIPAFAE